MNQPRLNYLLQAYFYKSATLAERDELMELINKTENDRQLNNTLTQIWQHFNSQQNLFSAGQGDDILAAILQKHASEKPAATIVNYSKKRWLRVAAAAVVACFVITGITLWMNRHPVKQFAQLKNNHKIPNDSIVPGSTRALLTLSDGSSIELDSNHRGTLVTQGNAKVSNLNTSVLSYKAGIAPGKEIVYNTLATSSGGQYELLLSDGTKAWLNASSSIHYPTIFEGKVRAVTVTGEVYFEVAKNPTIPFIVTVKDAQIQVLGTHFNIMAYEDESSLNTTLLEGSVRVSQGSVHKMLVPGKESRIQTSGEIKIIEADIDEVMAWKNGWFQFNGYDIEKVMRQVSRWYNVEVAYEGKIPVGHFTGSVSRGNNISQVLKIMEQSGVGFKIEGRKVRVYAGKPYSS
jgi:transmembrane sensor